MRIAGHVILTLSAVAALAAIWVADWRWQLVATAALALFIGAGILGQADRPQPEPRAGQEPERPTTGREWDYGRKEDR